MQPETANPNTTNKPPGQRIAYRRVSTLDQSTARQLDGLTFDRGGNLRGRIGIR
jgi:hypothetical protein